jgi:DNA-binding GntR family transcriptional regulator
VATGFRGIADQLRRAIARGDYPAGARIPTEHQLARAHEVSRETVRRALSLLKTEGLLSGAPGRGTHVTPQAARQAPDPAALLTELADVLDEAEHHQNASTADRLTYLERRALILHRLVDALGDDTARDVAIKATQRATQARQSQPG